MQYISRRFPGLSACVGLASLLAIPLGNVLYRQFGNAGTRIGLFLGLGLAIAGIFLGMAGMTSTRGERLSRRFPGILGILLDTILALFFAFLLFLQFTPNAPL